MAPKRANRLPLIGILCLAFVLIVTAALFIWFKSSTGEKEAAAMAPTGQNGVPSVDGREGRTKATTTNEKTQDEANEKKKKTEWTNGTTVMTTPTDWTNGTTVMTTPTDWTNGTTVMTTTTTTTTTGAKGDEVTTPAAMRTSSAGGGQDERRPTAAVVTSSISATVPLEELTGSRWQPAHVPICRDWAAGSSDECVAEEGSIASPERRGQQVEDMDPMDWLRPVEYSLNMSLPSEDPHRPSFTLDIQLSILVELSRETSVIPLHCGSEVDIVEEVRIWSCSSEAFVCVRSMSRLPSSSLLLLHLLRPLPRGALVRLQFPLLRVPLSSPNAALFVHIPSPWERHQSWMIGSQFPLAGGVRSVFPSVDSPSGRAVLRLCLTHSKQTIARSNAPIAQLHEDSLSGLSTSCFRDSPALPPAQFAFLLFRNLRPVTSPQPPAAAAAAAPGPLIELFIGAHLNPPDYAWAVEESRKTMERMRQITSTEYALEKLTLVSSPLQMGNDAMGALGLAHIRDSWMEYPKFVHTHELLIGQLIRQWTSNVLSLCDQCIQQGLGLYLEWMVGSEQLGTEPKAEFGRRFGEARQRLMAASSTMAEGSSQGCAERVAVVVHMLERGGGPAGPVPVDMAGQMRTRCRPAEEMREQTNNLETRCVYHCILSQYLTAATPT
uniref:Membrane-associated protein n=1 Tax=Globodera pallida TaxID=36090 RepID=A0A183CJV7_GLOPA